MIILILNVESIATKNLLEALKPLIPKLSDNIVNELLKSTEALMAHKDQCVRESAADVIIKTQMHHPKNKSPRNRNMEFDAIMARDFTPTCAADKAFMPKQSEPYVKKLIHRL